jgi:hypothetical protein
MERMKNFLKEKLSKDFLCPMEWDDWYIIVRFVGTCYGLYIDCDPEENNCRIKSNYVCFKTAIWSFDKKMMIQKPSWGYGGIEQFFRYEDVVDELKRVRELAISTPTNLEVEERIEYYNFEHVSMDK